MYIPQDWALKQGPPYVTYTFQKGVFTPEECRRIIDSFSGDMRAATVNTENNSRVDPKVRVSNVNWIYYDDKSS